MRSDVAKRERNKYYHKTARNLVRELRELTDKKKAQELYKDVASRIDRLAKNNVIHSNKAANLKSSMMRHINSL